MSTTFQHARMLTIPVHTSNAAVACVGVACGNAAMACGTRQSEPLKTPDLCWGFLNATTATNVLVLLHQ